MAGRLEGRVAIVSGGVRGIGGATTRRFVAEGATVVFGDLLEDEGLALERELGPAAKFVKGDATQPQAWDAMIEAAQAHGGGLDILVNNVGGAPGVYRLENAELDMHRQVMDWNLTSNWLGSKAAIAPMRARGGGSIVNISSIDGIIGISGLTSYVAAKFAVTGMTKTLALELGQYGIRVNAVHPGMIATPLVQAIPESGKKRLNDSVSWQPLPRLGKPEEIAAAVLFFASDDASYCTGASLVVDGGHLAGPPRVELG